MCIPMESCWNSLYIATILITTLNIDRHCIRYYLHVCMYVPDVRFVPTSNKAFDSTQWTTWASVEEIRNHFTPPFRFQLTVPSWWYGFPSFINTSLECLQNAGDVYNWKNRTLPWWASHRHMYIWSSVTACNSVKMGKYIDGNNFKGSCT